MPHCEKSIEVNVPISTAYNQWTQFKEFPEFMEGLTRVDQLDDRRLHWVAVIAGNNVEWDAIITEQIPEQRIAWHNTTGATNAGLVTFESLGPDLTRVDLTLDYEPEGFVQTLGDRLGIVGRRVEGDLERFKQYIETRGVESGAWRGHITASHVEPHQSAPVAPGTDYAGPHFAGPAASGVQAEAPTFADSPTQGSPVVAQASA